MLLLRTVITFLKDKEYRSLMLNTLVILAMGTVVYRWLEGWGWLDSFYFSVITLTTIGYGDLTPQTDEGKLFTVFYIVLSLGLILGFVHAVYEHYRHVKDERKEKRKKAADR